MIEDKSLNISLYEYKKNIGLIKDPEKGTIISEKNAFENSSIKKERERSQRGESMLNQNINMLKMSKENKNGQNSNIQSYSENISEDPINRKSVIEAKNEQENKIVSPYPIEYKLKLDIIDNKEKKIFYKRINEVYSILEESTIILIINYHKENIIKYDKIIYKKRKKRRKIETLERSEIIEKRGKTEIAEKREIIEKSEKREKTEMAEKTDIREITYEQFTTPSKEEQEQKYDLIYNNLFESYKKLIDFLGTIKENAFELFSEQNLQKELLIKINLKEDKNKNAEKKYIISKYIIENSFSEKKMQYYCYQDIDILNEGNYEGFKSFSEKIIELEKLHSNNNIIKPEIYPKEKQNLEQENNNNNSTKSASNNKISIKKNGKQKEITEKVREFNDGLILSDGRIINFEAKNDDSKLSDERIINFEAKNDDSILSDERIINFEANNDDSILSDERIINFEAKNDDKNKVTIILKNHIKYNKCNSTDNSNDKIPYPCKNIFKFKDGKYVIYNETGIYKGSDLFSNILRCQYSSLSKNNYKGGIKINNEILAFMPNSNEPKKEDKLINSLDFYNVKLEKPLNNIIFKNYSFLLSENNFPIMKIPKFEERKLLLIACKNKNNDDCVKNGILLTKLKINEDNIEEEYQNFFNTNNFEVYCFCPILKGNNILKNDQKIETEYFLVGGLDIDKNEGLIKLYKVIHHNEIEKVEIKFIQDIIIEKKLNYFEGFKDPISSIIQTLEGEILVICNDGNEFSFSEPNFEEMEKNKDKSNLESCRENL